MQNKLDHPPNVMSTPDAQAWRPWVGRALSQRVQDATPAEQERVCKTLWRLQPAADTALAQADLPAEAKMQALDSLTFLQTLRGLVP